MSLKLVGVTACPTGIAHTFMAAEMLAKTAKQLGHAMKVETNGSAGAENVLLEQEIAEADAVIIAADTRVETDRFIGKKVIFTSVSAGIHKAKELMAQVEGGEVPVFNGQVANEESGEPSALVKFFQNLFKKK